MSEDPYQDANTVRVTTAQPVAPPVVREQVVVNAAADPVVSTVAWRRRVVSARSLSPAAALTVMAAIALGVVGAVAIARAGLETPIDEPIIEVVGVTHTAVLGLIEVGMALLLLWAGLSRDRSAMLFVSILFG